jgi:hypothetical protein
MQLVGESRAFVALIETLQRQLVSLPKKFYVEMSIFACSRVVLLTTDGPFAETKEQLKRGPYPLAQWTPEFGCPTDARWTPTRTRRMESARP